MVNDSVDTTFSFKRTVYTHIRIGVGCNRSSALSDVLPSTLAKLLTLGAGHRVAEPPEMLTNLGDYF